MNKNATIVGILSTFFTLSTILLNTPYLNTAYAQVSGTPGEAGVTDASEPYFTPLNMTGPETATEFGNRQEVDEAVLANDTDISNPNIHCAGCYSVNEREDCMSIPGNTAEDCP